MLTTENMVKKGHNSVYPCAELAWRDGSKYTIVQGNRRDQNQFIDQSWGKRGQGMVHKGSLMGIR